MNGQVDAYNRRDVEAFLSYYSDTASLYRHPHELYATGKDQLRARYTKNFRRDVRASIIERIVFDRFVIDHERLTSLPGGRVSETIAVYEIKDGKIVAVTFLPR